jgi:Electron transfer DM13/Bacterial Ig-like domain (group 2)
LPLRLIMKSFLFILLCASFLAFQGCIGTDYIDDPLSPSQISPEVIITPPNTAVQVGLSTQFSATFVNESGDSIAVTNAEWTSSDTAIAHVSSTGLVTAQQQGQTRITVRYTNITSQPALVTVVANPNQVASVTVAPAAVRKMLGEMQQFSATAYNLSGDVLPGKIPVWHSTDTAIVSITAGGNATAHATGTANIVATIDGVESSPATFTVSGGTRTGTFVMRPGSGHDVRGAATLSEQPGGNLVLFLGDDFASAGGPDVEVFLSTTNTVGSNSITLGNLRNFSGASSYDVPVGVQLSTYDWVIIHCVPFNIVFGYARLQ